MAGTTFVDYTTFKTFWKQFALDREKSLGLLEATGKFSRLIGIGAALLILTGFGMMAITKGVFGEQLWFRIKFALVIVIIANALLNGRRLGLKLRKTVADGGVNATLQTESFRTRLNWFHLIQLLLFLVIIFLSVFKF
ncbi:MAG: hypothetical protein ABI091_07345, partial [Ferruginibacter sp.]